MTTKIFINGKIFTSNNKMPYAESMISENGVISWIGDEKARPDVNGEIIDLHGSRVIPGFVDSHMHPIILADCMGKISCLPPAIHSISELINKIKEEASKKAEGEWIRGWGYDEAKFEEHRAPTRWDLDKGSKDHPVEVLRSCSHIRSVNSKALELAGITKDTPDPPGGKIDKDASGEPTGILFENAANLMERVLPQKSRQETVETIVRLGDLLISQGIIAVADMGNLDAEDYYRYYWDAAEKGFRQQVGVYYMWNLFRNEMKMDWSFERAKRTKQIFDAGIKIVGDGSVGGKTAWMSRPYKGSDNEYGILVCNDEEIDSAIEFCKNNNCQLSFHAMGMRTIDKILKRCDNEMPWMEKMPHIRLEHFTDPSEEAIDIAAKNNIAISTQAIFMYAEIESYMNNLGEEWLKRTYPIKHILEKNVKTALSTDAPATSWAIPSDPFSNIKAAVTRYAYDGTDCGRENCIDVETALQMYTREGAYICGFDDIGQLSKGYKASFAVLSDDIINVKNEDIDKVSVIATYLNGEKVYEKMR